MINLKNKNGDKKKCYWGMNNRVTRNGDRKKVEGYPL